MQSFLDDDDRVLPPRAAAVFVASSTSTLAKRRMRGEPPAFVRLGRVRVGYRLGDLRAWLASCRRVSTRDPGPGPAGGGAAA